MEPYLTEKPFLRAKLIFNPASGLSSESPAQLIKILKEMQSWKLLPEVYIVQEGCDLGKTVQDALEQGIRLFAVSGGDGTVSSLARELAGKDAVLGIIPIGTQNNIAGSLDIPADISEAVALLRSADCIKADIGLAESGSVRAPFLEICSVGLFSTIYSAGDDIQHGHLLRIGDFLAALANSPPAQIHLLLDHEKEIRQQGHVLLICNMPQVIHHFQVGDGESYRDGLLDILFYTGRSKLDLMGYVLKGKDPEAPEDPRIQHFRVKAAEIDTEPAVPVMADGNAIGKGHVRVEVRQAALNIITGRTQPGECHEK